MNIARRISTEEMIAEFLKAELHSSRFRAGSLKALELLGYDESLLENPNLQDTAENKKRAKVLGLCRGWPDTELFADFPKDIEWFSLKIPQEELEDCFRLKRIPSMTNTERSLSVTAEKLKQGSHVKNVNPVIVNEIIEKIEKRLPLPPIILVGQSMEGKKVLIEGHSRSIAYSSVDREYIPYGIPTIIGISPKISEWAYY